jgi:hypothetical protein
MATERHLELSFLAGLPLSRAALDFAREHHGGQRRVADGAPFAAHLVEVASLLERSGYPDHVVAAAVLHDVLEDTDTKRWDLDRRFGAEVGELVAAVSDDPAISDEELRKDALLEQVRRAGGYAAAIYAADKISKVRDLRLLTAAGEEPARLELKLGRYRKALQMLEAVIPGSRLVELLRFELEELEQLPPIAGGRLPASAPFPTRWRRLRAARR